MFSDNEIILFQGDSITDGGRYRNNIEDQNHLIGHSFPYLITAKLALKYIDKKPRFYSRGVSGNDILQVYARWREDAIGLKPTIINLLVGVNDAGRFSEGNGSTPAQYENVLKLIIEETRAELPNVKFVLCEPFYFPYESNKNSENIYEDIKVRQEIVKRTAMKYSCVFVPLQKVLEEYADRVGDRKQILWDGTHPTPLGHSIICEEWFKVIKL